MKKLNIIDMFEKTGDIPKWKPVKGACVEVFKDPMTEHKHEGVAKIVQIHSFKNGILDCDVVFKGKSKVVRRTVKTCDFVFSKIKSRKPKAMKNSY